MSDPFLTPAPPPTPAAIATRVKRSDPAAGAAAAPDLLANAGNPADNSEPDKALPGGFAPDHSPSRPAAATGAAIARNAVEAAAMARSTLVPSASKAIAGINEPRGSASPEMLALAASVLEPIRSGRFAERVYEHLFHAIVDGKIAVGSRLPSELDLAGLFDVSRPIVRQALDRLREDGMVESIRGSGTYVREAAAVGVNSATPSAEPAQRIGHILNGLELRLVFEPECAYMAALRRQHADLDTMDRMLCGFEEANASGGIAHHHDFGFHEAIAIATGNERFVQVMKGLEYDISHAVNLLRHLVHIQPWQRTQDAIDEHRQLYHLIKIQDAEGARRAMRGHLENARTRMFNSRPGI